jgi:hypothetical protein
MNYFAAAWQPTPEDHCSAPGSLLKVLSTGEQDF